MNILIDIGHPAHVHVFKHYHDEMVSAGHQVLFTCKDKECAIDLLQAYELPYELIGKPFSGAVKKLYGLWHFGKKVWGIAKRFEVDMFISISSMYAAHVAFLMGRPHIVLDDTEHSRFEHMLYRPFSTLVVTPSCFEKHMGVKHIRYDGYHELAYLHPLRFNADASVLKSVGIAENEAFSLLRFVSWNAGHDIKQGGLTLDQKRQLVQDLSAHGRVLISSEKELPEDLEEYRINISPEQMHDVLNVAALYLGEGASMASECAMLGTPAIYVNSLNAGTLKEQEAYGLIYGFRDYDGVSDCAKAILMDKSIGSAHKERMRQMLTEKIDVTAMLCGLTEAVLQEQNLKTTFTKMNYKTV